MCKVVHSVYVKHCSHVEMCCGERTGYITVNEPSFFGGWGFHSMYASFCTVARRTRRSLKWEYVCLSVCLSVCLCIWLFTHLSPYI